MQAQCELKAAGMPYPRTCPVCKLGPCQRDPRSSKEHLTLKEAELMPHTYDWHDLPAGGWIDVTVAEDGDVWIKSEDQEDRTANIYMGPLAALNVAEKLLEAARRGLYIENQRRLQKEP